MWCDPLASPVCGRWLGGREVAFEFLAVGGGEGGMHQRYFRDVAVERCASASSVTRADTQCTCVVIGHARGLIHPTCTRRAVLPNFQVCVGVVVTSGGDDWVAGVSKASYCLERIS
jgi:hypothetical protein